MKVYIHGNSVNVCVCTHKNIVSRPHSDILNLRLDQLYHLDHEMSSEHGHALWDLIYLSPEVA